MGRIYTTGKEMVMAWAEKRGPWYRVRYRDASGAVRTTPDKYRTKKEALEVAEEVDTDTRRGVFIDPKAARTSLGEWVAKWRAAHHIAPGTQAKYDQYLDHHILPAFGHVGLEEIRRMAVTQWAHEQRGRYAESTVRGMVTLFSLVMSAAVEERMIASNPIQSLRLPGSRTHHPAPGLHQVRNKPVPTGKQVLAIAKRAEQLGGRAAYALVVTAAFTGMRWGEITGLAKPNCRTADGYLLIAPDVGALHEVGGKLWLGPPKSRAAARRIDLPPFLAELLAEVIDSHEHEQVFCGPSGAWLRRSNVNRRLWRLCCDGDPERDWPPILVGAVFHGLRHFHKTVLDESDPPPVLLHERMGHHMPGIQGVYSHVTTSMRKRLTTMLQRQWTTLNRHHRP
jgi:integrase